MKLSIRATTFGMAAGFAAASLAGLPAGAQTTTTTDNVGQHNAYCGAWKDSTWVPNGNCVEETTVTTTTTAVAPPVEHATGRVNAHINGTITSVTGHLVTLQQATRTLIVNDQPALDAQETGRVAVGRQVQARGYWDGGTFFATRFEAPQ